MNDPPRWSRTPGLPDELARALAAGRAIEPPPGARQQVLDAVVGAAGIAAASVCVTQAVTHAAADAASAASVSSAATSAAAASASLAAPVGLSVAKIAGVLLVGAGAAVGAAVALHPAQPAHPQPQHVAASHAPDDPHRASRTPAPAPAVPPAVPMEAKPETAEQAVPAADSAPTGPPAAARAVVAAVPPASRAPRAAAAEPAQPAEPPRPVPVESEAQWVLDARAQLQAGDLGGALESLERAARASPHGVLLQERELLRIRVLQRAGAPQEAARLAQQFVARHPDSPYAAQLRAYCAQPVAKDAPAPGGAGGRELVKEPATGAGRD